MKSPSSQKACTPSSCPFSSLSFTAKFAVAVFFIALLGGLYFLYSSHPTARPSGGAASSPPKVVAITQIADHTALNETYRGILKALADAGYENGKNLILKHESASGNLATAHTIATHFASLKPDCMVGISTPSAQSLARHNFPLIFTAVTNPVDAKLVTDIQKPGKHISGVACYVPELAQLELIRRLLPSAKKVGILYNPGEANSASSAAELKRLAPSQNLEIMEAVANNTGEVTTALLKLLETVDAILLPQDNTVATAITSVLKTALTHKVPVFVSDKAFLSQGAVAGCGYDWQTLGEKTGELVVEVLKGRSPGAIPVVNTRGGDTTMLQTWVNSKTAALLGMTLTPDTLKKTEDLGTSLKDSPGNHGLGNNKPGKDK